MHNNQLKVAVIGGGSSYTPELIEGLITHYDSFPVTDVYLVDIEAGRHKLDIVAALATRMIEAAQRPIRLHATLDRREAISGADFVLTQLRVGLLDARAKDERIPLRYKRIGQETTGAGGCAKALRTIPVILDICKEIEELAPHAFLINFTNPAGIITEAVLKHTNVKTIGLCNLPIGVTMQMATLYDVDPSEVEIEMVGINHLNWTTTIAVNGHDVSNDVFGAVGERSGWTMKNIPDFPWDPAFLRSLQALPCGYHRYYYMQDAMLQKQFDDAETVGTRAEVVKKVEEELFTLYQDPDLRQKPAQLEQRGGAYYSEVAIQLIHSIYNDRDDVQIVNVQNNGTIACLPDDVSIEVNCKVNADGAHPLPIRSTISPAIRGLLQVVKTYEELTVQAGVYGDYDAAWQALTIHPLVGSANVAKNILDDILSEHAPYLPQFQ